MDMKEIYKDLELLPLDLQGWNGTSDIFKKLIEESKPNIIIEVGTWKGQSANNMANCLKELKFNNTKIYCIDTWLGALEFMTPTKKDSLRDLMQKNGYPQVYYQFLSNVVHCQNEDIIIPVPNTSKIGYEFLLHKEIKAQLIYIDASHDEASVYEDLSMYWNLLDTNGIIFGDDWKAWPGVKAAVEKYSKENKLKVEVYENNFWIIRK